MELFGEGASDLFTIETFKANPNTNKGGLLVGMEQTYKALSNAAS